MTINEAYVKGLDDAENNVIENLIGLLNDQIDTSFPNPKLEIVRQVIKERSDYFHKMAEGTHGIGKGFKNKIENARKELENAV